MVHKLVHCELECGKRSATAATTIVSILVQLILSFRWRKEKTQEIHPCGRRRSCLLLLAVSAIVLAVVLTTSQGVDEEVEGTAPLRGEEHSGESPGYQEDRYPPVAPAFTTIPSAYTEAGPATHSPTTMSPTTRTTTEKAEWKPDKRQPLLCTVGKATANSSFYPPDGLCDVLFYTHVRTVGEEQLMASENNETYEAFRNFANDSTKTGYGVSLDSRYLSTQDLEGQRGASRISFLWKSGIMHLGVLNADGDDMSRYDNLGNVFKRIREIFKELRGAYQWTPGFLVLASRFEKYGGHRDRDMYAAALRKWATSSSIDLLVLNTVQLETTPCTSLIPTPMESMGDVPNIEGAIEVLKAAALPAKQVLLVTFTLAAVVYELVNHTTTGVDDACTMSSMTYYEQLCQPPLSELKPMRWWKHHSSSVYWNYTAVFWNTAEHMETKFQRLLAAYPRKSFGLMLLDVEYESEGYSCREESLDATYPRIRAMRTMLGNSSEKVSPEPIKRTMR